MRRFVIKKPNPGRSTVTIVTHEYKASTGRTRTVYLGSFSAHLDPDTLVGLESAKAGDSVRGIRLKAGTLAAGSPFALDVCDIEQIRRWLMRFGTVIKKREAETATKVAEQRIADEARTRLVAQVEAELRSRLESDWRAAFLADQEASRQSAMDAAVEALKEAGQQVIAEARALRAQGQRLTRRECASSVNMATLDGLLLRTVAIRKAAFEQFEEDCKVAGLMTRKTGRRTAS